MTEPNLLGRYFEKGSAAYVMAEQMRRAAVEGRMLGLGGDLVEQAKADIRKRKKSLDQLVHGFAEDVYHFFYGRADPKKVIMLVKGDLVGADTPINDTLLPIDLGGEYYKLFKPTGNPQSIDDFVTEDQAKKCLREVRGDLVAAGYTQFSVKTSRIYFVNTKSLRESGFLDEKENVQMLDLVPYISEIDGYVVTNLVQYPTLKSFMEKRIPLFSYRIKSSMGRKMLRKMGEREIRYPLSDWVAIRMVAQDNQTREEIYRYFPINEDAPPLHIGNFSVQTLNVVHKKGGNTFEQVKIIARVRKGKNETVAEFQFWTLDELYPYEINPEDPRHHRRHQRQEEQIARSGRFLWDGYAQTLEYVFERDIIPIDIRSL